MKNKVGNFFLRMLKGACIGISMIIPGLSAGTVSILLKIHEGIINAVTNLFKKFKESFLFLLPILIGAAIGFLGLAKPIKFGLSEFPLITVTLFVGLVIGGLPSMIKAVKDKFSAKNLIISIIFIGVIIGICFLVGLYTVDISTLNVGTWLYLMFAGFVGGSALVVSGISGSMSLMVLGVYDALITIVSDLESALIGHEHVYEIGTSILYLIPVFIGIVLSFIIMSFVMKFFLSKFPTETNYAIIGLTVGSIGAMYFLTFKNYIFLEGGKGPEYHLQWFMILIAFAVLVLGFISTFFMEKLSSKKSAEQKLNLNSEQEVTVKTSENNKIGDITEKREEN
jgi:putative membrane protein